MYEDMKKEVEELKTTGKKISSGELTFWAMHKFMYYYWLEKDKQEEKPILSELKSEI